MKNKTWILIGIIILIVSPVVFAGVVNLSNISVSLNTNDKETLNSFELSNISAIEYYCGGGDYKCFKFNSNKIIIDNWAKINTKKCLGRNTSLEIGGCNMGWINKTNTEIYAELDKLMQDQLESIAEEKREEDNLIIRDYTIK